MDLFQAMTEVNLWKKAILDGKHKTQNGNIKQSTLIELAELILGPLPSIDDSLSTQEVSEQLLLMTIQQVSRVGEIQSRISMDIHEKWIKNQDAKTRKRRADSNKWDTEYILQQDSLISIKPQKASNKKKKAVTSEIDSDEDKDDNDTEGVDDELLVAAMTTPSLSAKKTKQIIFVTDSEDSSMASNASPSMITKAKAGGRYTQYVSEFCGY